MTRIPLTGGAYQARSVVAGAQRCVNLYVEPLPQAQGEPAPAAHYPTPGLIQLVVPVAPGAGRGIWMANNGTLFAVVGQTLYSISSAWWWIEIGTIPGTGPVSMMDNGTTLVVVNGTTQGWSVDLNSHAFAAITDAAFYGADRADYLDTFFLFNKPGTPQFYVSNSNAVSFDPLYFANKSGSADNLVTLAVVHREIWLIGEYSSEVWFDSGAADFPFQIIPGAFIEQGCAAKYSVARNARALYWLAQDRNGERQVVAGSNYEAQRISTFAIEEALRGYGDVSDAWGYCYQQDGHSFYVLNFPGADATWVYDITTGLWHERGWLDSSGMLHRHRLSCATHAYGKIVGLDWQNGTLYALDLDAYTDAGQPIQRIRSWPHLVQDGDRVMYRQFIADMEVGRADPGASPQISLRWSDSRGVTWGNPILLSLGQQGDFLLSVQAQRLGMARDRVFEVSWSEPVKTALLGAFVETTKAAT